MARILALLRIPHKQPIIPISAAISRSLSPNTTLRIPAIINDRQNGPGVDPSLIDVIVSSTVAERGLKSLKGRLNPIDGCLQDLPVEAKTSLKFPC
jgi:hypothetical protein